MGNVEGSAKFIQEFAVFLIQIILKTYTANKILNISSPVESAYVGRRPQKILLLKISPPPPIPNCCEINNGKTYYLSMSTKQKQYASLSLFIVLQLIQYYSDLSFFASLK